MLNLLEQRIFIVDDDELMLKSLHQVLSKMGIEDIQTFNNGTDCVNALNQNPFIVLLDYEMAGLSGFEVLRKIKRYNPNTYVLMLSAQADIAFAVDTLKFGAFDYIVKGEKDIVQIKNALDRIIKVEENILAPRPSIFSKIFNLF